DTLLATQQLVAAACCARLFTPRSAFSIRKENIMQLISKEQIERLDCSISDIADSLHQAFSAAFSGDMKWQPKNMIGGDNGAFLMSTFCSWPTENLNIFHSLIGATYPAQDQGAAAYQSVQLLAR